MRFEIKILCIILFFLAILFNLDYSRADSEIKKQYYPNGKIWQEIFFKANKLERIKEYYRSGKLRSERFYKSGVMDGLSKEYYESGAVRLESLYKNGKAEGVHKEYFEDGTLKSELPYKDGKFDGLMKYYDKEGNLKSQLLYSAGMPVIPENLSGEKGSASVGKKTEEPEKDAKIKISSPVDNREFHPGDEVEVKVEAAEDITMVSITAGYYAAQLDKEPPFELKFKIPKSAAVGPIKVIATGRDEHGGAYGYDKITIHIVKD